MIELLIHEMDRTARYPGAVVEGLMLRVESGERGQERGVDVENAERELAHEGGAEQSHVPGEANEVDLVGAKLGGDQLIVGFALEALRGQGHGVESQLPRRLEPGRLGLIRNHHGDLGVELAFGDITGDRSEVRAAPGKKNTDSPHD